MAPTSAEEQAAAARVLQEAARHQLHVQDFGIPVVADGLDPEYLTKNLQPILEEGLDALLQEVERAGEVDLTQSSDKLPDVKALRWLAQWLMRNNPQPKVSSDDQSDLVAFAHRKHEQIMLETGDSRAWIRTLVATQSAVDQQFEGLSMRDVFSAMDTHRDGRVSVDSFVNGKLGTIASLALPFLLVACACSFRGATHRATLGMHGPFKRIGIFSR